MLLVPHAGNRYTYSVDSSPTGGAGAVITSGAAHTYGNWTYVGQTIGAACDLLEISLQAGFTAATARNSYIDLGFGPSSLNPMVIATRLCGTGASTNFGRTIRLPVRLPAGAGLYARHQNTVATSTIKVNLTAHGGAKYPGLFPRGVLLEPIMVFDTVTTTGAAITVGASGAEGAFTLMQASTGKTYKGFLICGPYCTDTNMALGPVYSFDLAVGASGQELVIGTAITKAFINSAAEDWVGFSDVILASVPAGQRITVRGSCSGASETGISVGVLGLL